MTADKKPKKQATSEVALDELKTDLQRVQADFVNFRRRAEGERAELMEIAKIAVVQELLPLFDNLDRALKSSAGDVLIGDVATTSQDEGFNKALSTIKSYEMGLQGILKQADKILNDLGITKYGEVGEQFDPALHEAIAHEGDGHEIVEVLQSGYRSGERIIRPALVKVGDTTSNHKEAQS